VSHCNAFISQAAKDARASQDALIDIFERIEMFFQRLEIYTEVPLTMEMMDIITQIMVEVISILGIATKEIKQGRMSKYLLYKYDNVDWRMFRKICEEADWKD
jgi:sensor histidine kinase YesM